ncbi:unnamed protein product [Plutella xylostella]|uniref:(diamondback moth) hypothetical protein n=1 Tax=Plutella xylostella TaxID=51655 RepID=A0A8S4F9C6_PLUXY|nr:unnamed protein product [Plutella xylostella]
MASKLLVITLALLAAACAAPVSEGNEETTTVAAEEVGTIDVFQIIEIPVVIPLTPDAVVPAAAADTTDAEVSSASGDATAAEVSPASEDQGHKVSRRSLRGDNVDGDLLTNLDSAVQSQSGLSELDGRKIKFLPTWVG